MKANRFMMLLVGVLMLSACTKAYYGTDLIIRDYTVNANKWNVDEEGGYFYAVLDVPEITQRVLNEGTVQISKRLTDDSGQVWWTPLTQVRAQSDGDVLYSTYLDYEWTVGRVYIYYTATDFFTEEWPEAMSFRITIMM